LLEGVVAIDALTHPHTGWLVLAAQKVAPSVQTIEDAKRDKLIQADIERQ
jgi:hypothetical protein